MFLAGDKVKSDLGVDDMKHLGGETREDLAEETNAEAAR